MLKKINLGKAYLVLGIVVLAMVLSMCLYGCATVADNDDNRDSIGYVIIPHADGDEHAEIYNWTTNNGIIYAYCVDGRFIASPRLIVVTEKN